jgi:hypothetical protein
VNKKMTNSESVNNQEPDSEGVRKAMQDRALKAKEFAEIFLNLVKGEEIATAVMAVEQLREAFEKSSPLQFHSTLALIHSAKAVQISYDSSLKGGEADERKDSI